jgi:hypothetical protein
MLLAQLVGNKKKYFYLVEGFFNYLGVRLITLWQAILNAIILNKMLGAFS